MSALKSKIIIIFACVMILLSYQAFAYRQRIPSNPIEQKEFIAENLYISIQNETLNSVLTQLPNALAWQNFLAQYPDTQVYIDPRSGRVTNLITHLPFIPGTGYGNLLTFEDISNKLNRSSSSSDTGSKRRNIKRRLYLYRL